MEHTSIRQEFDVIAGANSDLGIGTGELSYAYARVSSAAQAEEGASGLPRQFLHIHEAAIRDGLRVPFDFLYVDDGYSGFEFVSRPAFTRLRYEIRSHPRALHLIVEEIDRLSRNADWHQGFLLNEFNKRKVDVHFFSKPGSELERYIRGYMAQEAMKKELERMRLGKIYKAMDGRVTSTRAAYGYEISHPKDSHYVLKQDEASVVKMVYDWTTQDRKTLNEIAKKLNDMGIPGRRGGIWSPGTLLNMVKNEVYKGWYIANHRTYEIVGHDEDDKPIRKWRTRPEEEWIRVPVPAIVSSEQWDDALEVLKSNRTYSTRRPGSRSDWLLSGLVECSICGYKFRAARGGTSTKGKQGKIRYYHCGGRWSHKARALGTACRSPYVHADALEKVIWGRVRDLVLDPARVLPVLQQDYFDDQMSEFKNQIGFVDGKLDDLEIQKTRWDAAYARAILSLDEYEEKITSIRTNSANLKTIRTQLEQDHKRLRQEEDILAQVEQRLGGLREGVGSDLPIQVKREIATILIDKIALNSETGEGQIHGSIPPTLFELRSAPR